jgi:drug/metabolite transporter (DMT)-like permease
VLASLSDWVRAIEGTPDGARAAMALALMSAAAHAVFGALQKGRHDPWITRGAIDLWIAILSAPAALFLVPWPAPALWPWLAGALAVHFVYKLLMALAYERAAYTLVYPVVRGTGPLATVAFAALVFGEGYGLRQWAGVALLSGGILALAAINLRGSGIGAARMRAALGFALAGGLMVAAYTTWDALGIRAAPDPMTFLAWFFFITALDFALLGIWRWRTMPDPPAAGPLMLRGAIGAVIAWVSFGGVMLATRLDKVGEAAVLRETSVIFAGLIGWLFLRERVGPAPALCLLAVAAGAVMVEFGGQGG